QVVFGKFPARDVLHDREKIDAVGVEFDLETGWARLTLQRGRAGEIAIAIREFPPADNALGGFAKLRRRLRRHAAGKAERNNDDGTTRHSHPTRALRGCVTNAWAATVFPARV